MQSSSSEEDTFWLEADDMFGGACANGGRSDVSRARGINLVACLPRSTLARRIGPRGTALNRSLLSMEVPVRVSIAGVLAAALIANVSAAQSDTSRPIIPTINAAGQGRREVAPDKATIVLGVETRSKTPAAAASANADRMTRIRAALTRMGVAEKDISTSRYSLHFEQGRTPADTQYVATNMVTVVTRNLDQVGRLID